MSLRTNRQKMPPFSKKTIKKMIRSVLPKRVTITDEFINAVNRCAQIYILSIAGTAQKHFQTTHLNGQHVIGINGEIGFQQFVKPLIDFETELKQKETAIKVQTNNQYNIESDPNISNVDIEDNSGLDKDSDIQTKNTLLI